MRGQGAEKLVGVLFRGFWDEVATFDDTFVTSHVHTKQWTPAVSWMHRAREDGSISALTLLDFRVNRLSRLLGVSDCWPSEIGLHLAHWMDTHMHLVIAAERAKSGPPRTALLDPFLLRTCDWRYESAAHTLATREVFFHREGTQSAYGTMYTKLVANMALCKTLSKALVVFGSCTEGKEIVCSAFTRCILGVGAHKASTSLRKSVHEALDRGIDDLFAKIINLTVDHEFPIVFACLREHAVISAKSDYSLNKHLHNTHKWRAFSANVLNTAEMVRVRLRARGADGDLFLYKLVPSDDEKIALLKNSKKVPGLFARCCEKSIPISGVCKLLKRARDRCAGSYGLCTDVYTNAMNVGVTGMCTLNALDIGTPLPVAFVSRVLEETGGSAARMFVDISEAASLGADNVERVINTHALDCGETNDKQTLAKSFSVVSDCIELMYHSSRLFTIELPEIYGDKQRAAVRRRFGALSDSEAMRRATQIIWCSGCKCVKNFVLSDVNNGALNHLAYGFKKVSQGDQGIMCYEKRRFVCCKNVPVNQLNLLSKDSAKCVSLFGSVFAVSTCCGWLAHLHHLSAHGDDPLCCRACIVKRCESKNTVASRICHYCEAVIKKRKGTYTGVFETEEGAKQTLSFCSRHKREFMRRDREPLMLQECMHEIAKKIKIK